MDTTIYFEDVMSLAGFSTHKKSGNMVCPFCGKKSFKAYPDQKAQCHNKTCGWHGDALQFYTDHKGISRNEAFKELAVALELKAIKFKQKKLTFAEATNALAKDLEFLAWCRMYFAFYNTDRVNQKIYADKSNLSQSAFNKILNGNVSNIITWKKALNILRIEIPIDKFKKDLALKSRFFKISVDNTDVSKFMK